MKRRYKEGDWIRIPLDAHVDALGIIARACRSRLFGYFFPVTAQHSFAYEELKRLRASDAAACALFGGAPIEESRWKIVASSLAFDRASWPFPRFVSRGAFGRVWTRHTYDDDTLQVRESHAIDEAGANGLPDARFASAEQLEDALRERLCASAPREPLAIYELRSGFDVAALQILSRGGRVQFSEALRETELAVLARFIERHPDVELRVHGFATEPFDVRTLREFAQLRALTIDARLCDHLDALAALPHLQRLRIGAQDRSVPLRVLSGLHSLRELEVHGMAVDVGEIVRCAQVEALVLVDTPPFDIAALACAPRLRELTIAHVFQPQLTLRTLPNLARLELRDMRLSHVPDLAHNAALEVIVLRNIRELRDLAPLASAGALRQLEISGCPQLNVEDFRPLCALANLRRVQVDLGSRRKAREVYRLLHLGKRHT